MEKEEIERLENIKFQLESELTELISKPISNESIEEARTIGSLEDEIMFGEDEKFFELLECKIVDSHNTEE